MRSRYWCIEADQPGNRCFEQISFSPYEHDPTSWSAITEFSEFRFKFWILKFLTSQTLPEPYSIVLNGRLPNWRRAVDMQTEARARIPSQRAPVSRTPVLGFQLRNVLERKSSVEFPQYRTTHTDSVLRREDEEKMKRRSDNSILSICKAFLLPVGELEIASESVCCKLVLYNVKVKVSDVN